MDHRGLESGPAQPKKKLIMARGTRSGTQAAGQQDRLDDFEDVTQNRASELQSRNEANFGRSAELGKQQEDFGDSAGQFGRDSGQRYSNQEDTFNSRQKGSLDDEYNDNTNSRQKSGFRDDDYNSRQKSDYRDDEY